eukprot:gene24148-biopygen19393
MPDTVQEWHAEEVIFRAFWRILLAFWPPKLAKSGLKHAPQRRGDTHSLPMGPIDGRKMQFWMRSTSESCRGYPPLSLTVGIRAGLCTPPRTPPAGMQFSRICGIYSWWEGSLTKLPVFSWICGVQPWGTTVTGGWGLIVGDFEQFGVKCC